MIISCMGRYSFKLILFFAQVALIFVPDKVWFLRCGDARTRGYIYVVAACYDGFGRSSGAAHAIPGLKGHGINQFHTTCVLVIGAIILSCSNASVCNLKERQRIRVGLEGGGFERRANSDEELSAT
ncbi:hypothetical protein EV702DRAFT_1106232 [Suillus placidus]|uniref:Uncharacterized protein n=1 Tax=Suillus placidus TaxID=48579 RepID=A0A9P6ZUL7_9AGAM|nr:hypothetical protein EV702DRAFT_1106232 [Suillus placidus]